MRILRQAAFVVISLSLLMVSQIQANGSDTVTCNGKQDIVRVAGASGVKQAMSWFGAHEEELTSRQLEVTRIPAPPFAEAQRALWLQERFRELGLEEVHEEAGNVFAVRPGSDPAAKYIALTAHLDTVFPAGTPLDVRREGDRLLGPGISDNGAGITALLALAAALRAGGARTLAPILFIGNVGEEGEGDLRGMRQVFADPRWRDSIGCTLVVDGAGNEAVVTEALGSRRFQVTVHGPGGHSWSDFGLPNPIVVLARAIDSFSRTSLPTQPKTSANIGIVSGGTSVNAIPESATMKVDIRSASMDEIDRVEQALRQAIEGAVRAERSSKLDGAKLDYEMQIIGDRPAAELPRNAPILPVLRAVGARLGIQTRVQRASTDANIPLSLGRQAVALGAGGNGGGAHTLHEWYDPAGRALGLQRILLTALALAGVQE